MYKITWRYIPKILFILSVLSTANCQLSTLHAAGTTAGVTLEEPASTRAAGLGEAYTALAEGPFGSLWNPAGLSYAERPVFEAGTAQGFLDTSSSYLGLILPRKKGGIGVNVLQYSAGDAEILTLDASRMLSETKNMKALQDNLVQVAWGRKIGKIDMGVGARFLQSSLAEEYNTTAFCADFGLMLRSSNKRRSLGLSLRNIGGSLKYIEEAAQVPMTMGVGMLWRWIDFEKFKAQLLLDLKQNGNNTHIHFGNELLWRALALRLGYQTGYELKSLSAGFGMRLGSWLIDFSHTPFSDAVFGSLQRFSLSYEFSPAQAKKEEREPEAVKKIRIPQDGKVNMAVSNFEAQPPISPAEADFVTEFFRGGLTRYKVFRVIDRQNMDKILAEQGFQQTGCTTSECAVLMGKILNVHKIITGKVGKLVNRYVVTISILDIETGEIEYSDKDACYNPEELEVIVDNIVKRLASAATK
ncbi:MAG TPA: PorV/PorQ family protein [bacterium]|nr:PorV/PorQ family protein [bacterium]